MKKQDLQMDKGYQNLLHELQGILSKGQYSAYKAVDSIKVQSYWQLGERIVREELKYKDRADYGKGLIKNIAVDLRLDKKKLHKIIKFYRLYEKVVTLSRQLSWNHYVELIKVENDVQRTFYQDKAIINLWSVRELRGQIRNNLYKNTSLVEIEEVLNKKLPEVSKLEIFKETYDLGFTGLHQNEKQLEDNIVKNIDLFLKELGEGIYYGGRQVPIKIDGTTHYIDLVLYHKSIPCNILIDLKTKKLDSRDIGQMNKYVNYYRKNRQYKHEKDTIGLIICKEIGKEEVLYALGGLEERIFIAKYKAKLPSNEVLKKAIIKL